MDRTLWHHERNHEVFFNQLHSEMGWGGGPAEWARTYLAINDRLWDHIQEHNLGVDYVRARRFPLLFREMGLEYPAAREAAALGARCESLLKERLPDLGMGYDGVGEAFQTLRQRGFRLHILTNGVERPQRRKIAALGLEPYVDVVMTSDVAGCYKPAPGIFAAALKAAGVSASSSWMVGDSVLRDVLGGQGVGMHTAWFRAEDALPPDAVAQPDFEFGDWRAFPDLLESALRGH